MYHRLIYTSGASVSFSADDLQQLLHRAREVNQQNAVTGLLLYKDKTFFQYLEGPKEKVEWIWDFRVKRDKRHSNLTILLADTTPIRLFGQWSMAYVPNNEFSASWLNRILALNKRLGTLQREPATLARMLEELKNHIESSASQDPAA